ncbi:MAG: TlpA family protein disulfide reductase [Maricaulaceae bacterium]|nr:TlpA family protein disulfide reductase [Maricaulaceae bacterium]
MKLSPLKIALTAMPIIAAAAFLYVIFSALDRSTPGDLDSFATGEMRSFVSLDDAPPQPRTVFRNVEGEELTLADFRGRIILVNLWATWCPPCVVEMPSLNTLQAELGGEDFQVVTISFDRTAQAAQAFLEEHELTNLPLYHDNTFALATAAGARGLPMSILYDRNGREIGRLPGEAHWDSPEAMALIRAAIARY